MQNFSCSALLRCRLDFSSDFGYGAFTLSGSPFQKILLSFDHFFIDGPTTPAVALTTPVWALARSLATTYAITFVFFSSGY